MKYKRMPVGIYYVNCYIVYDEASLEAAVIDPGGDFEEIKSYIEKNKLIVKYIIITHGHGDHIFALPQFKQYTNAPICINKEDAYMLNCKENRHFMSTGVIGVGVEADRLLADGDVLELGNTKLHIIHTPGHSRGSICISCENELFSGDTLFASSVGRADLEGSSFVELIKSIKNKLMILPDDVTVHPGHGSPTTIGKERMSNPFINR
ncbi:MAG: MBL fold metallo-hydrolase [Bacillota bacterium]